GGTIAPLAGTEATAEAAPASGESA
ncbi:MAG: hypothetical protein RLY75_1333, partial [Pseudomonadota bacterium]